MAKIYSLKPGLHYVVQGNVVRYMIRNDSDIDYIRKSSIAYANGSIEGLTNTLLYGYVIHRPYNGIRLFIYESYSIIVVSIYDISSRNFNTVASYYDLVKVVHYGDYSYLFVKIDNNEDRYSSKIVGDKVVVDPDIARIADSIRSLIKPVCSI